MTATSPPRAAVDQLAWLVDRAAISDVLIEFARCLDDRDWHGYLEAFTPEAFLELPFGRFEGRAAIAAHATKGLDGFAATHHVSANHAIEIAGDRARARSSLIAAHVPDAGAPGRHGDAGGWYDSELVRTSEGWRLASVALRVVWTTGTDLPG